MNMIFYIIGIFNWTMSYSQHSDFSIPFGKTMKKSKGKKSLKEEKIDIATKTKLVAWIVSHCTTPSKREHFVGHLMEYITVDIFGKCGKQINRTCGRSANICE